MDGYLLQIQQMGVLIDNLTDAAESIGSANDKLKEASPSELVSHAIDQAGRAPKIAENTGPRRSPRPPRAWPSAHIMNLERGHHLVDGSGRYRQLAGSRDDGSTATRPHGEGGFTTLHLEQRAPPGCRPWSRPNTPFLHALLAAFHERTGPRSCSTRR